MNASAGKVLAAIAALLATAALIAGDPPHQSMKRVDAVELGELIRDRRPIRILDVRPRADFEQYRIPTAEHLLLDTIAKVLPSNARIVVYSDGGAEGETAARLLARNYDVAILEGGIYDWLDRVMSPQLPANPSAQQREQFERQKLLSEYFGGAPSIFGESETRPRDAREALRRLKRRTC